MIKLEAMSKPVPGTTSPTLVEETLSTASISIHSSITTAPISEGSSSAVITSNVNFVKPAKVKVSPFRVESISASGRHFTKQQLKEWVWKNYQDEIFEHLAVDIMEGEGSQDDDDEEEEKGSQHDNPPPVLLPQSSLDGENVQDMRKRLDILEKVARAHHQYLQAEGAEAVYTCLIDGILELMRCDYGFIGEVKSEPGKDGAMYLQCHGLSLRSSAGWSEQSLKLIRSHSGLRFYNLESLWGKVLKDNKVILTNDAQKDRIAGTPPGHPPLLNFLGIPIQTKEGEIIGMIGIANSQKGFSERDVDYLKPFIESSHNVMQAYAQAEEHKALVNTLEQKVEERTKSLLEAIQNLERANQRVLKASALRLQHFACMSHEIRTPLNCILGMSGLLLQEGDSDHSLSPIQRESMQMIVASGDLLLTVVNDVLDYAKLETGNVDINPRLNNLQEMLNALIHAMEMKDHQQHVSIITNLDPRLPEFVTMDSQRMSQILFNLLGNALKFSKKGGVIEVDVGVGTGCFASRGRGYVLTPAERERHALLMNHQRSFSISSSFSTDGSNGVMQSEEHQCDSEARNETEQICEDTLHGGPTICFRVKDYGKGIESKDFAKIFQPFRQASAEVEQVFGGTGLGLAITGKLVHAMGGVIAVDSVEGEWTEFVVELPFKDAAFDVNTAKSDLSLLSKVIVVEQASETENLASYLSRCGVPYEVYSSMALAEKFFTNRTSPLPRENSYILLVNERMYDDEIYELLCNIANVCLITFGSDYSVRSSSQHIRSPCKVLPSVLWKSFKEALRVSRHRKSRTPSIASSVSEMNRYEFRILVAEDNKINQRVLHRMLSRIGVNDVTIVDDGQKAFDACLASDYDLIFMDMQMPVMDGLEACRAILESTKVLFKPKIVFATAHASKSFEADCAAAGGSNFHGFLPKPFTIQDIEKCLDTIVSAAWSDGGCSESAWSEATSEFGTF